MRYSAIPRTRALWFVLALGFLASGAGAPVASKTQTKHCLWKVQGKTTVYLFGSIHFLKKSFYPLPDPIEAAFNSAAIVGFETDLKEMEAPRNQERWAELGRYGDGSTIKDHLSPEVLEALRTHLTKTMGSPDILNSARPWLAAFTVMLVELQRLGFKPKEGVDQYFYRKAQVQKKEVLALETVESQLKLFANLSPQEEEMFLVQTLEDVDRFGQFLQEIIKAWKEGESQQLAQLLLDSLDNHPHLYRKFLTERNEQWVPKIERLLAGHKKGFIVVGAGHLVGSQSVVELLRKKGFKVEQQ